MGIDISQWRAAIGCFDVGKILLVSRTKENSKPQNVRLALFFAILLVMFGGVERNPGPSHQLALPGRNPILDYMTLIFGVQDGAAPIRFDAKTLVTLNENQMLDCVLLDAVSYMLKFDASQSDIHGLIPPTVLKDFVSNPDNFPHELQVSRFMTGVNMHHMSQFEHYVTSCKINNVITIYDSLNSPVETVKDKISILKPQLKLVYGPLEGMKINLVCPQEQGCNMNCGLHAIANALFLVNKQDPCAYYLLADMRSQLRNMLNKEHPQLSLFNSIPKNLSDSFGIHNRHPWGRQSNGGIKDRTDDPWKHVQAVDPSGNILMDDFPKLRSKNKKVFDY